MHNNYFGITVISFDLSGGRGFFIVFSSTSCSSHLKIFFPLQSVFQTDDLYPFDSEDTSAEMQLPQSPDLQRHGVSLTLSLNPGYEYKVLTHSVSELRELSVSMDRIEIHNLKDFFTFSSVLSPHMKVFNRFIRTMSSQIKNKL